MGVLLCISFKVYRLSTNGSETKEKERKVLLNLPNQKHLQHLLEIILLQNLKIMHQPLLLQKILKQRKKEKLIGKHQFYSLMITNLFVKMILNFLKLLVKEVLVKLCKLRRKMMAKYMQ